MGNQCSSQKSLEVVEVNKDPSKNPKSTPTVAPTKPKVDDPPTETEEPPPPNKHEKLRARKSESIKRLKQEVEVFPSLKEEHEDSISVDFQNGGSGEVQVKAQINEKYAQHLVTNIMTQAQQQASNIVQSQLEILPPFIEHGKKLNDFQLKIKNLTAYTHQELLLLQLDPVAKSDPIGYVHESCQNSILGHAPTKKPILIDCDQNDKKVVANLIGPAETANGKDKIQMKPPSQEFIAAILKTHENCYKQLEPIYSLDDIHLICQHQLQFSNGARGRNENPILISPAIKIETVEAMRKLVDGSHPPSLEVQKTAPPSVSKEQIDTILEIHEAACKLFLAPDSIELIHQICQLSINNKRPSQLFGTLSRSQKENGKKLIADLISKWPPAPMPPQRPEGDQLNLPAEFIQNILKTHSTSQSIFEAIPKNNLTTSIQNGDHSSEKIDSPPLPPHVVRQTLRDLEKINLLAKESVEGRGLEKKKSLKKVGYQDDLRSTEVNAPLSSPVAKNSPSRFSVTFADGSSNGEEGKREVDEVAERRSRLMNRKQTGIFFHKDLQLSDDDDDDDDEDEKAGTDSNDESDSDSTTSDQSQEIKVTPVKMEVSQEPNLNGKDEKLDPINSPRRKLASNLIAKFQQ